MPVHIEHMETDVTADALDRIASNNRLTSARGPLSGEERERLKDLLRPIIVEILVEELRSNIRING